MVSRLTTPKFQVRSVFGMVTKSCEFKIVRFRCCRIAEISFVHINTKNVINVIFPLAMKQKLLIRETGNIFCYAEAFKISISYDFSFTWNKQKFILNKFEAKFIQFIQTIFFNGGLPCVIPRISLIPVTKILQISCN